jgi:hypothetical protein
VIEVQRTQRDSLLDRLGRDPEIVEDLQGSGHDRDRAAFLHLAWAGVDDAGHDTASSQFGGQHQPGRSSPDDENR